MECECCGQHVTTWNDLREREVEDETVRQLLEVLQEPGWKKVADNAVQLDLPDGFVTVIVRPYIQN